MNLQLTDGQEIEVILNVFHKLNSFKTEVELVNYIQIMLENGIHKLRLVKVYQFWHVINGSNISMQAALEYLNDALAKKL